MPTELETLFMTDNRTTVAGFIRSRPAESRPYLISAVSACMSRNFPLNSCELHCMAREIRYNTPSQHRAFPPRDYHRTKEALINQPTKVAS